MLCFISGGVKGGKSMFGQYLSRRLADEKNAPLVYIATMIPYDAEDEKRVSRHLKDREGWGFSTIEEPRDLSRAASQLSGGEVVLIDSLTALVQNTIFPDETTVAEDTDPRDIARGIMEVAKKASAVVTVSDYIFSDAYIYHDMTELFRRILGRVHCLVAENADIVLECGFSNIKEWKNLPGYDLTPVREHYYKNYDHLRYFDI